MSLLDDGPDRVDIYVEVDSTDGYGTPIRVASDQPIPVSTRVQPISADEAAVLGQSVQTVSKFRTRSAPGGAWARIHFDGRDWDVVGEPLRHNGSDATRSRTFYIKARTPQEV